MTKPTRDQRVAALLDLSRRARTTGGNLEDKGRSREAIAYDELADRLLGLAVHVQAHGWNAQQVFFDREGNVCS